MIVQPAATAQIVSGIGRIQKTTQTYSSTLLHFTSNKLHMNVNRQRLLDRFLQYVSIDTTANEKTEDYPSSTGQLEIGKLFVALLQEMVIEDAHQLSHIHI